MKKSILILLISLFYCFINETKAQESVEGSWEGIIITPGKNIGIKVHFQKEADSIRGLLDIQEQSAIGLQLNNISVNFPKVYFEYNSENSKLVFEGSANDPSTP